MGTSLDDWTEGPGLVRAMRHYAALVIALAAAGMTVSMLWSWQQAVEYSGTVHVFLNSGGQQGTDPGRLVRTRAQFLTSPAVMNQAAQLVGGGMTARQVSQQVSVVPSTDADIIIITALGPTAAQATKLADSVVQAYIVAFDEQTMDDISSGVAFLDRSEAYLARQIQQLQARRADHPSDPTLAADTLGKQEQLAALAKQREQLAAVTPATRKAVSFRETALGSPRPVSPHPARTAAIGGVLGLLLGAALAWRLEGRPSGPVSAASHTPWAVTLSWASQLTSALKQRSIRHLNPATARSREHREPDDVD